MNLAEYPSLPPEQGKRAGFFGGNLGNADFLVEFMVE